MRTISLSEINQRLVDIRFHEIDIIVAIGKDGIKPAYLLQKLLKLPVEVIWLNYRDVRNKLLRKEPKLTKPFKEIKNKKILIVDSISKTGKTLRKAKEILKNNNVKTFVINGKADYSLFNFDDCIDWQW